MGVPLAAQGSGHSAHSSQHAALAHTSAAKYGQGHAKVIFCVKTKMT
ncbi:MAG: hypothetical protein NZ519_12070 [Bacteroidia bacterium]|nr:hypothetical protein [Bacteroidia bacterium]